jgi:hypothetical protein
VRSSSSRRLSGLDDDDDDEDEDEEPEDVDDRCGSDSVRVERADEVLLVMDVRTEERSGDGGWVTCGAECEDGMPRAVVPDMGTTVGDDAGIVGAATTSALECPPNGKPRDDSTAVA